MKKEINNKHKKEEFTFSFYIYILPASMDYLFYNSCTGHDHYDETKGGKENIPSKKSIANQWLNY